jgi:putative flippase GtrA
MKLKLELKNLFVNNTNNLFLQLIRYTIVGGGAFAVDFCLLYTLTHFLHLHYLLSATISFTAGLVVNYIFSTIWVFNKKTVKNKYLEFLIFTIIGVVGLGFNDLFMWIFTDHCEIYYLYSKVITTAIVYFWNFFARKYILFK